MAVKRPLAVIGFTFLLSLMFFIKTSASILLPLAVLLAAIFVLLLLVTGFSFRQKWICILLVLFSIVLAAGYKAVYDRVTIQPLEKLYGQNLRATVLVENVTLETGDDTVTARLRVLHLTSSNETNEPLPYRDFIVQVKGMPEVVLGDKLEIPLRFYPLNIQYAEYSKAKGIFIGATPAGRHLWLENQTDFIINMRILQAASGDKILQQLPRRLSSVAAAMTVGDARYLEDATGEAYRKSGLSHLLVVSGLHLSVIGGSSYWLFQRLLKKRFWASIFSLAVVGTYMAFTGFTPSIVRSGIATSLVLMGGLFRRRADIYTSLGLAALVLTIRNPYSAADVGLQLSFASTMGAVVGAGFASKWTYRALKTNQHPLLTKWGKQLASGALVALTVTAVNFPILILASSGISLLSVPANLLAVPLLTPIIVLSLLMLVFSVIPGLGILAEIISVFVGVLLVIMDKITMYFSSFSWGFPVIYGTYWLVVVTLVLILLGTIYYTKRIKETFVIVAITVCVALLMNALFSKNVVTVTVAPGQQASLVVVGPNQTAILYNSSSSRKSLKKALDQNNRNNCDLLIDMRQNSQTTEYKWEYDPKRVVIAQTDILSTAVYDLGDGIQISIKKQGDGLLACVEVGNHKFLLTNGKTNLNGYPKADVVIAGKTQPEGLEDSILLVPGNPPEWVETQKNVVQAEGLAEIVIRREIGFKIREVHSYGIGS